MTRTLLTIIDDMHTSVKRSVLFRIVGSLNSSVIYNVLAHIRKQERGGLNLVRDENSETNSLDQRNASDEANRREPDNLPGVNPAFASLVAGMDHEEIMRQGMGGGTGVLSPLAMASLLHRIRDYLLDQLLAESLTPPDMTYKASLDRQLSLEVRPRSSDEMIEAACAVIDMPEHITPALVRQMELKEAARSRAELGTRRDTILAVTDTFSVGCVDINEAEAVFDMLPPAKQAQIAEMLFKAVTGSMQQLLGRLSQSGSNALGDVMLLKGELKDVEALMESYRPSRQRELRQEAA